MPSYKGKTFKYNKEGYKKYAKAIQENKKKKKAKDGYGK
jgi:hypothetical protein|tara:strand:- start:180 stop:296 length:117 start_codon:yes stop_codon:yes gene_type:complete